MDTEVDEKFIEGMRNRMQVSYHKYGPVAEGAPKMDAVASLMQRLRMYASGDVAKGIKPGNIEYLIDAANFAMIEFMYPKHPDAHFKATDDNGSPGRIAARTGKADARDNVNIGAGDAPSMMREFR